MATAPNYRFVIRPVWILGHLVVIAAIVGFFFLGQWQLDRHHDRQAFDREIEARFAVSTTPLTDLDADIAANPSDVEYRSVTATGRYRMDDEVVWQARTYEGSSGHQVLTPLELMDGTVVMVDRGWVPIDATDPPVAGAEPPTGEVTVTGFLRRTQVRGPVGPVDPPTGELARISRVDLDRLAQQIDGDLLPMWIQLAGQEPGNASAYPRPMPPPTPGDGPPHFSYAMQWFLFAGVVAVSYPFLIRKTARDQARGDGSSGL